MQPAFATRRSTSLTERDIIYLGKRGEMYKHDESIPSLPVPPLHKSLKKYLESLIPHLSDEEFLKTKEIVDRFEKGVGLELHLKLVELSKQKRNWLEEWWEDVAYLSLRFPLIPYLNMAGGLPLEVTGKPDHDLWLIRAGLQLHYQMHFWKLLRREQIRPFINRDAYWNMDQFRRLFSTTRIPGIEKDEIKSSFRTESSGEASPLHVVVFCQGYIFSFNILDENEEPYTAPEITKQLQGIYDLCQASIEGPGVGALSAANRTVWAKNRECLSQLHPMNKHCLEVIDSAIIGIVLGNEEPQTNSEVLKACLIADCSNRWADKSATTFIYRNGTYGGSSDHAPFDGLVIMAYGHYVYLSVQGCDGVWQGTEKLRDLPKPRKLEFHINDSLENEIQLAKEGFLALSSNIQIKYAHFNNYGKSFTKPFNIRPEAYVQMALQLAYFRLHGKPGSTYMTASTRQYYHGRTETCRTCTTEVIAWAKSMDTPGVTSSENLKLLYAASDKFNELIKDGMNNSGCDRHLLGLQLLAQESGLQIPEIFLDPSWSKAGGGGNFILSTSCGGYTPLGGCVAPMSEKGYGCFYSIENQRMSFQLSAFNHCEETCTEKLYNNIETALLDMQQLLFSAKL